MEYARLGKTGRKVTRIGFGGAPAGLKDYLESYDPDDGNDREKSILAGRIDMDEFHRKYPVTGPPKG